MRKSIFLLFVILMCFTCKDGTQNSNPIETSTKVVERIIDTVIVKEVESITKNKSSKLVMEELKAKGFTILSYVDEKTMDTVIMQQYFIAFLKKGPIRGQPEEEAIELHKEHLAYLDKMHELGYADISGSFDEDGDVRGVTVYNVPTLKMADSLANADPIIQAKRLEVEMHPLWDAKGASLR